VGVLKPRLRNSPINEHSVLAPEDSLAWEEPLPSNMRILKIACILVCLLSVVSIFKGTKSMLTSSSEQVEMKHYGYGTLYSAFNALIFGVAFYGIQRRMRIFWKLGWGFLGIVYLEFLIRALSNSVKHPQGWIASIAIVIGSLLVAMYWGYWWQRQRSFFAPVLQETPHRS